VATVTGLTKEAMQMFVDAQIVSGSVDSDGHLELQTRDGNTIDAGLVAGQQGPQGPPGPPGDSGGAPSGAIMMFGASLPPTGWLVCDGSAVSRTTYSMLFSVIGTIYGSGDGATTFNLPNFAARTPRMDNSNLALKGGTAPTSHVHTIDGGTAPAVAHVSFVTGPHPQIHMERIAVANYNSNFDVDDTASGSNLQVTSATSSHGNGAKVSGTTSANTVSSTSTDLLPPFLNVNFIIKI
jgi:microcystin-dependent protein